MTLIENRVESDSLQWSERPVRLQQRFLVLRKLGQGTYGKVQLALNKETNQEVAIKTIKKARIESEEDMLRMRREIQIMASIRHPHIIHINEVFETRQKIVLVMQYASGGELYDYLGCHQKLPEAEARRVFRQISSAIYYCHKNRICHRDLKLENILLDEEGNAQIADFGLSNIFDERRRMSTFCGSPLYASPEIVKGTPYKGPEVDCWSLGVLLYTLIYGTMPFDGRNFKELVSQISEGKYEEPESKSKASNLIRSLLTPDISKRATIFDVCKDNWVNDGYKESLLKLAEQMASENHLNGENLVTSKICLEKISKNGYGINYPLKSKSVLEPQNGKINLTSVLKNCISNTANRKVSEKPSLYEQILNYDVRFIINKLITAVESTILDKESQNKQVSKKENLSLKPCLRNRDAIVASKIDSAYIIPIFEVTTVVPKMPLRSAYINQNKMNSKQLFKQDVNSKFNDINLERSKTIKTENINSEDLAIPKIGIVSEISKNYSTEYSNEERKTESSNIGFQVGNSERTISSVDKGTLILSQQNNLSRVPTPKTKKKDENVFTHKFGPFFQTKNHALSIARLFSLNFEKLSSNSLRACERRQKKSPGKIVIPSTFDPTYIENSVCERKEILIFPTISVSENKEKIEKKIDKIKKAALNMNLIQRSNSKNRLKIQKYLKSQAKKIKDLVLDEQRNFNISNARIKKCETVSVFSDVNFGKWRKEYLNSFNIKHHSKKINFLSPNNFIDSSNSEENLKSTQETKWNLIVLGRNLFHQKESFNISKSKSDDMSFLDSYFFCNSYTKNDLQNECKEDIHLKCNDHNFKSFNFSKNSQIMSQNEIIQEECKDSEKFNTTLETMYVDETRNIDNLSLDHIELNVEEASISKTFTKLKDQDNAGESLNDNKSLQNLFTNIENFLSRTSTNQSLVDLQNQNTDRTNDLKRLSSEPSLRNLKYDDISLSNYYFPYQNISKQPFSVVNEDKKEKRKKVGPSRRNTLGCITEFVNDKNAIVKNNQENNIERKNDFQDCLWMMYVNKKILSAHNNKELAFLSSPNLYNFNKHKSYLNDTSIDRKSMDVINQKLYEASLSSTPVYGLNEAKSAFLRKLLLNTDSNNHPYSSHSSRLKSVSENILTGSNNLESEYLRKTQSERKLSLPYDNDRFEEQNSPFFSKFLNELEKQGTFGSSKSPVTRRPLSRNSPSTKKSSTENRNKSFLQLMSLKRIQEAEKELNKVERNDYFDNEEENSGSLLEALKAHGYKNVISQRFQVDDNTEDKIHFRYPKNPLLSRTLTPDIPRAYFCNFDPSLHNGLNYLDYTDYNDLNGFASPLSFQLDSSYNPQLSKQLVHDWLTTNLSEKYLDSTKSERNVPSIPEDQEEAINTDDRRFFYEKENSLSVEDDPSSSDSFDPSKEFYLNGTKVSEFNKVSDDINISSYASCIDRNPLFRTSSTSEDEREESVQDRIWRKSFYSRFNNSVLSRKDKGKLDVTDRLGFINGSTSYFISTPRDRSESFQMNMYTKNSSLKRASTVRLQNSRKNSLSSENSLKIKSSKSIKSKPIFPHRSLSEDQNYHTEFQDKEAV